NVASRFFAHPGWYPLARISYGTYLIHPFVLFGVLHFWLAAREKSVNEIMSIELMLLYSVVMALASALAVIMFVAMEGPLLRLGVRWARRYRAQPVPRTRAGATEAY